MHNYRKILFSVGLAISIQTPAQQFKPDISIETGVQASVGRDAPFWLTSNKYGLYSINRNQGYVRVSAIKAPIRNIDYYYGLDIFNRYDGKYNLILQQAYAGLKFKSVTLYGGNKEEHYGNQEQFLSSGGNIWSGNARPMPLIYLGIPEYVRLPYTWGLAEIKGGIVHGWFGTKDQYIKDAYLHYKYVYLRFGPEYLKFHCGIQHAVMWGGTHPVDSIGKIPSSFKDFISAFTGKGLSSEANGFNDEKINALGNHLASYQFGFDIKHRLFDFRIYWQTFLEDKNGRLGIDWKNRTDGIWGLCMNDRNKNSVFQTVLFEFIHTTSQSGDPSKSGGDNYYNNYLYGSGWTYYNMTIGTPLITSPIYEHGTLGSYSATYLKNNGIIAYHFGLKTKINKNIFFLKSTLSFNYGIIGLEKEKRQFSSYLAYSRELNNFKNLEMNIETGFDTGALLGTNFGLRCSLKKQF